MSLTKIQPAGIDSSNSTLTFGTSNVTAITINGSQNVGIGTTSPGYPLDIQRSSLDSALNVQATGSNYSSFIRIVGKNGSTDNEWNMVAAGGFLAGSQLRFTYGGWTGSPSMVIDNSGNVGIGNTAPAHKLSVTGTANVSGNANVGNIGTAAVVATANVSTTAKYVKTTGASITGGAAANITRYPTFTATSNADIHLSSTITGNATVSQNYGITFAQGSYGTTGAIMFSENNSDGTAIGFYVSNNYGAASQLKVSIEPSGTILPGSNVAQNLGSTTLRWSTVYTGDLELSNGIGDYTIVEGEDDLFLYNNRSGKTYRFMLQEVDPAIVPPKKGT